MRAFTLNFKKIVSAVMAIVIMCICTCDYSTDSNAANTTRTYKVYNATTGEYLRSYTLDSLSSSYNTRSIIGTDDRVVDYGRTGCVKLLTTTYYSGSGFIIDDTTVATAAHCVYSIDDDYCKPVSEILAFDAIGFVAERRVPVEIHIPANYVDASAYTATYDYALITIDIDEDDEFDTGFGYYNYFNLGVPLDSIENTDVTINVKGFSQYDKNNNIANDHEHHVLYKGVGEITDMGSSVFSHNGDTTTGNSGCPVYITETRNDKTYYTVIGIHVLGGNSAVRITTDLIHFYYGNPNI